MDNASIPAGLPNSAETILHQATEVLRINPRVPGLREAVRTLHLQEAGAKFAQFIENNPAALKEFRDELQKVFQLAPCEEFAPLLDIIYLTILCSHFSNDFPLRNKLLGALEAHIDNFSSAEAAHYLPKMEGLLQLDPNDVVLKNLMSSLLIRVAYQSINGALCSYELETFKEPLPILEKALLLSPQSNSAKFILNYFLVATALQHSGELVRSFDYVTRVMEHQEALANSDTWFSRGRLRFFQTRSGTLTNLGQMANEMEYFVKAQALGIREQMKGMLLAPREQVVNPCLMNYMREKVCIVTDPLLIRRAKTRVHNLEYNTFYCKMRDGKWEWSARQCIGIQREWEERGGKPIFTLSENHREQGKAQLRSLGLPEDAWFVSLHVRDQTHGKMGIQTIVKPTSNRDADIGTYSASIAEIVKRGGWVIRMGDPSMTPLSPMENVIDYPHSTIRSDWMDIYLAASCKFFIGTVSGVHGVVNNFGVPTLLTNVSPMASYPMLGLDLFLPKILYSKKEERMLTFKESLTPPLDLVYNMHIYESLGISLIPNTEDEIRQAVIEMFDRLENRKVYTEADESLQKRFRSLVNECQTQGIVCRIGNDFLKSHAHLL